jgi:hypothetical protein
MQVLFFNAYFLGYGKMKFHEASDFDDFSTTMSMYNDYITLEPFVPNIADVNLAYDYEL